MSTQHPTNGFEPSSQPAIDPNNITQELLDGLKAHIELIQTDAATTKRAYNTCRRQLLMNRVCLSYLVASQFTRTRAVEFLGFRWAVVLLGSTLAFALFAVVSLSLAFGFVGAIFGAIFFACMLYLPGNAILPDEIHQCGELAKELATKNAQLTAAVAYAKVNLVQLQQRYSQCALWLQAKLFREAIQRRRQELAASDWKSLQGNDFQHFLASAFLLLDYEVEETGQTGDHGVDLIAKRDGNRIAIQAKGYASGNSVDNKAVQEAYSGKDIWQCQACAVITNSRYTKQAIEDAARLGCVLIDALTLQALIVGQRDLWQECVAARPVGPQMLPNQRH